ncbi:MAG: M3 family metallopeptidase [Myxococcota bacterium]|nr:M3 family metallopeptidase [Myxococcota bacterium]
MNNALTQCDQPPQFDAITIELMEPTLQSLLKDTHKGLDKLETTVEGTWEGSIMALHRLSESLEFAWGIVEHLMSVQNSDALRAVHDKLQPELISFHMRLGQSQPIYDALVQLKEGPQWPTLSEGQQRVVDKELLSMKHAGIGLVGEERERFVTWQQRQGELSTQFTNNVLDSTKAFELIIEDPANMAGLPESFRAMTAQSAQENGHPGATAEQGPWRISLDAPVVMPFLQHAHKRDLREQIYTAYITRASSDVHDNQPLIDEILTLRQKSARLLGYESYAETSLATKMAEGVSAVDALEEKLRLVSYDYAQKDHEELQQFARNYSNDDTLELKHWDVAFYAERLKEEKYTLSDEVLRPYFQFPKVLNGLFDLVHKIFDITVVPANGQVDVWHQDVLYFEVQNKQGQAIANFYLDPYSRPAEKRGGAWMNAFYGRELKADNTTQLPLALLVCNQTPPVGEKPSLMSFREVSTLFHEFGHGLQHMLTEVDYPQAAGINNVEWDAVELPSQFMENWCYHQETLLGLTEHVETGEQLPNELYQRIVAAKNYRAGSNFLRQLYFGTLDMELHDRYEPESDETVPEVKARIAAKNTILTPLDNDRFLCSFAHIFAGGYAAGYYSYKWAEVLSADAFSAFEEAGLENDDAIKSTGMRFRETVLALGGSQDPNTVFSSFRGRAPAVDALLRHNGLAS